MASKFVEAFGFTAIVILALVLASACGNAQTAATSEAAGEIPRPSNSGDPGEAVSDQ
jgi:hypothetical protein